MLLVEVSETMPLSYRLLSGSLVELAPLHADLRNHAYTVGGKNYLRQPGSVWFI